MTIWTVSQIFAAFKNSKKAQLLTIISITIAAALFFQWAEAQPSFCKSCHEMDIHVTTWQESTHYDSANCLDCHLEPGIQGQIDVKIRGVRELLVHVFGNVDLPINNTIHVKDEQCVACHQESAYIPDKNIDVRHNIHTEVGLQCVDCHANIVHAEVSEPKIIPLSQCESCHEKHNEFPMTDDHSTLKCSECHINGVYKEIESTCESCHISHVDHIYEISTKCEACHALQGWEQPTDYHIELPLTEKHSILNCVECHPKNTYKETSTLCESCHNLPNEHFNTADSCDSCHTAIGWKSAEFDHSFYQLVDKHQENECTDCHIDNLYVDIPKQCELCHTVQENHEYEIASNCEACHDIEGWKPATASHVNFPLKEKHYIKNCADCHADNNYYETPQSCESCHNLPIDHFNTPNFKTSEGCEDCHTAEGWKPADFDHSFYRLKGAHNVADCTECHIEDQYLGVQGSCESCHNPPTDHPVEEDTNCNSCHTNRAWKPVSYDHSGFALTGEHETLSCSSCHINGEYAELSTNCETCHSTPTNHPVENDTNCDTCHTTSGWLPANFDHSSITSGCNQCHNNADQPGKDPGHITTTNVCEDCHSVDFWEPALQVDHTQVTGTCASCHDENTATGKHTLHIASKDQCDDCHTTNDWSPAVFDHSGVVPDTCSSCHDGVTATGKQAQHIETNAECYTCHSTAAWLPATFDHAYVAPSTCSTCHDGTAAPGMDSGHFQTVIECDSCHTTSNWSPDMFLHASATYPGDHAGNLACTECHQTNAEVVTWTSPAYQPDCAGCHANDFKSGPHKKYENSDVRYTVAEISDCTGACHVYTDETLTTIKEFRSGPEHRVSRNEM